MYFFTTFCPNVSDTLKVKPINYDVRKNGEAFLKGAEGLNMPFDRCVVIHADERRDFGDIELTFGGRTEYV